MSHAKLDKVNSMNHQQSQKLLTETGREVQQSAADNLQQKRWNKPATVKMSPFEKTGEPLRHVSTVSDKNPTKMLKCKSVVGPAMLQVMEVMEEIRSKEKQLQKPRKAVKKKRTNSATKKNAL